MHLYVGTYSISFAGMGAGGRGIYRVPFDTETGAFGAPVLAVECGNASSMVASASAPYIYAVREVFADHHPCLQSFRVTPSGGLEPACELPIAGELPCQIALDPAQSRIAAANYWSGDVAICSVADGVIAQPRMIVHTGNGPNAGRQEGPHPHFVTFTDSGAVLHVADLGTDTIASYRLGDHGEVTRQSLLELPAGSGPRHMAVAKDAQRAWVLCELDESLVSLRRTGLGWEVEVIQDGFPSPEGEDGSAAAIRLSPDERHVYISGRRQSQIAEFAADGTPAGAFDCGGDSPREFMITPDGRWVISANQDSNTLTSLARNRETGALALTGHQCKVANPVALIVAPEPKMHGSNDCG